MTDTERHDEILELISARLDGELSPEEEERLDAELARCPALREEVARFEGGVRFVRSTGRVLVAGDRAPAGFRSGVMRRVRLESPARPVRIGRRVILVATGLAAALLLAVILDPLGVVSRTGPAPEQQTARAEGAGEGAAVSDFDAGPEVAREATPSKESDGRFAFRYEGKPGSKVEADKSEIPVGGRRLDSGRASGGGGVPIPRSAEREPPDAADPRAGASTAAGAPPETEPNAGAGGGGVPADRVAGIGVEQELERPPSELGIAAAESESSYERAFDLEIGRTGQGFRPSGSEPPAPGAEGDPALDPAAGPLLLVLRYPAGAASPEAVRALVERTLAPPPRDDEREKKGADQVGPERAREREEPAARRARSSRVPSGVRSRPAPRSAPPASPAPRTGPTASRESHEERRMPLEIDLRVTDEALARLVLAAESRGWELASRGSGDELDRFEPADDAPRGSRDWLLGSRYRQQPTAAPRERPDGAPPERWIRIRLVPHDPKAAPAEEGERR